MPDLKSLSIADLCHMFDICQHLERTLLGEVNSPALSVDARAAVDEQFTDPFSRFQIAVVEELTRRAPGTVEEGRLRDVALARWHLLDGDYKAAECRVGRLYLEDAATHGATFPGH